MDYDNLTLKILENFDIDEDKLIEMLTTIEFRLNKNHYHFNNLKEICSAEDMFLNKEYIYYETENLLINIRSTVDIVLQIVSFIYKFEIGERDLTVRKITGNAKCTNIIKETLRHYTHPKNKFWSFISSTRNDIVHESCIKTRLPVVIDETIIDNKISHTVFFIDDSNCREELFFFYRQCIELIDNLCNEILYNISRNYR